MKKTFIILALLLISIASKADSLFNSEKLYFITCYDPKKGGIEPAKEGNYPLIYNVNASENTEKALWIITEEKPDKYSIKNSKTGQYIEYSPKGTAEKFIKMADRKNGDLTLFYVKNRKTENNIVYWSIAPVGNPNLILDKRKYNAVGPYQAQYSNNQLFSFKEQKGNYVKIPSLVNVTDGYLKSISFDNIPLVYDKKSKTYYCSIPIEQMSSNFKKTIHFIPKKTTYKINIEKQEIVNGKEFSFSNVIDKTFNLHISENNTVLQTVKLVFTGLPIVQLYTGGNKWSNKFSSGQIKITEYSKDSTGELLNADIRYRGATALSYSKKSFAIKLKDKNKKNTDRNYFGLRNDNYWILDAMASDPSRIRNRLCTDLWNDFSADPYFKQEEKKMINGTRGQFVEVFLDNQYWGLYCMTERIDRKQLKLKKYQEETQNIRGVLYKSAQWSNSTQMGRMKGGSNHSYTIPQYDNSSEKWDGYEVEYPELNDRELITWKPLYDVISFSVKSDNSTFKNHIKENIDFPVWLDYYLLMELIHAQDNHGKNIYFYMHDISKEKKLGLVPWDMDGTLGQNWDRTRTNPKTNYINFLRNHYYGEHHIYRRLRETNVDNYNSLLKNRYNELKSSHFSKNNLIKRVDDYLELFTKSGAKKREQARWNGINNVSIQLDTEISYIKKWISDRSDFLNSQYEK